MSEIHSGTLLATPELQVGRLELLRVGWECWWWSSWVLRVFTIGKHLEKHCPLWLWRKYQQFYVDLPVLGRWEGYERITILKHERSSNYKYNNPSGTVVPEWCLNAALRLRPILQLRPCLMQLNSWFWAFQNSSIVDKSARLIINLEVHDGTSAEAEVNSSIMFHAVPTAVTKAAAFGQWTSVSGTTMHNWSMIWCRWVVGRWIKKD